MRQRGAFTQNEISALFKAAAAAGVRVAYEVRPDGTKRIETLPLAMGEAAAGADIDAAIDAARL
jgi:hypothetical protein